MPTKDELLPLFTSVANASTHFASREELELAVVAAVNADSDAYPLDFSHREAIAWAFKAQWLSIDAEAIQVRLPELAHT